MSQKEITLKLLNESALSLAYYEPTQEFLSTISIGIAVNGMPFMIFGKTTDPISNFTVDRLLKSQDFLDAVEYQYGPAILSKIEFDNDKITNSKLLGIRKSTQGKLDTPQNLESKGAVLEAIFLREPSTVSSLALHCCIQSNIMLCIDPDSKPLSYSLDLKNKVNSLYS